MDDNLATVEAVYEAANQPFDRRARAAMDDYAETHPRGRHGGVVYDMSDFGIDERERRDALEFYVERFLG
jgi:hypothetical protein